MPASSASFYSGRSVALAAFAVEAVGCLAACGFGIYKWATGAQPLGLAFLLGGVALLFVGALLYCQIATLQKLLSYSYRSYEALLDAGELLQRQAEHTRSVAENSTLSDWAKRIVYREKDYEFLRDTIHGAIVRQDWEAAEHLIKDLDEEFGYREEAERLREELARARKATLEEKIAAAIERFEMLCATQKWDRAMSETARLKTLFPEDERIAGLPHELELRRRQYKRHLLKEYDQAIRAHEVNRAHRLLFELDGYLAPNEAAALKESARGVFKAKLLQMGVEFSMAVSDRKFSRAIAVGQGLIREFPNSRYAHEISQMMPVLQKRAQETPSDATASSS